MGKPREAEKEGVMPKEFINCEDYGREVTFIGPSGEREAGAMPTVAGCVVWNKEVGHVAVRIVDRQKDPDGFEALNLNLDREGINRMIRFLRKARDDAFGRDE